jgi:hypothetical protein
MKLPPCSSQLPPGIYKVTTEHSSFKTTISNDVEGQVQKAKLPVAKQQVEEVLKERRE